MSNQQANRAVWGAVDLAVWDTVYWAVDEAVFRAVGGTAYEAVDRAEVRAASADPKYPALQDFLRSAGAGVGVGTKRT